MRSTMLAVKVPLAGMLGEGKFAARGCTTPSMVKPVRLEGTPETSRSVTVVCQLKPCASAGAA